MRMQEPDTRITYGLTGSLNANLRAARAAAVASAGGPAAAEAAAEAAYAAAAAAAAQARSAAELTAASISGHALAQQASVSNVAASAPACSKGVNSTDAAQQASAATERPDHVQSRDQKQQEAGSASADAVHRQNASRLSPGGGSVLSIVTHLHSWLTNMISKHGTSKWLVGAFVLTLSV